MKRSNNINFVYKSKKLRTTAGTAPLPKALPKFNPLEVPNYREYGKPQLPESIDPSSETIQFDIFSLFFTPDVIQHLVDATNENAELNPSHGRNWRLVTTYEIYGYIRILIYIGLHPEPYYKQY